MIASKIQGRLGNNLFQIATAYSLAIDSHNDFGISLLNSLVIDRNNFQINKKNIFDEIKEVNDLGGFFVYNEPSFNYNKIPYYNNMLLIGYFQSESYFKHNKKNVIDLFENKLVNDYVVNKYKNILQNNTVSLHIRRGDYTHLTNVYASVDKEYYMRALDSLPKDITKIIFSDDINWCKQIFGSDFVYIENELPCVDLKIMSLCKHNIITNSSFSWWGAYLNTNENKKVFAPKKWFNNGYNTKDLYCEGWNVI